MDRQEDKRAGQSFDDNNPLKKARKKPAKRSGMLIRLLGAVVVLGLAVGAYFLSDMVKPAPLPEATPKPDLRVKLVTLTRDDFKQATITLAGESPMTVKKTATDVFEIEGKPGFLLDNSKAKDIEYQTTALTAEQLVEASPADYAQYGLATPKATCTATYADGTSRTFELGDMVPTGSMYYLREQGKPEVYAVWTNVNVALSHTLKTLHTVSFPTLNAEAMKTFLVEYPQSPDKTPIELSYVDDTSKEVSISALKLVQPFYYDAHSERATAVLTSSAAIKLRGYEGEATDLATYGLAPARYHLKASDSEGNGYDIQVGNDKDKYNTYVRIDETNDVYLMDPSLLTFLSDVSVPRMVDQFANIINITAVDQVVITGEGKAFTMSIERVPDLDESGVQKTDNAGKPATVDTYKFDGEVKEESPFKKLYQVVIGTLVDGLTKDYALSGTPVYTVRYKLNKEPGEVYIEYIDYDRDNYAVRRDGKTYFYIRKEKIQSMFMDVQAFKDGTFVPK